VRSLGAACIADKRPTFSSAFAKKYLDSFRFSIEQRGPNIMLVHITHEVEDYDMTEKAEWEVVDAPRAASRQTLAEAMKARLGPWWRWKLAGAAAVASLAVALLIALTGILILGMGIAAVAVIGIRKLGQWLRRNQVTGTGLNPHYKSKA
jgi:hypothetical protein